MPTKNNAEYYNRIAKCYTLLNEKARSDISVKIYHQLCGLDELKLKKLETELQALKESIENSKIKVQSIVKNPLPEIAIKNEPKNDVERCTSKKCKLVDSSEAGKYFVAGETMSSKIKLIIKKHFKPISLTFSAGETVLVEKAKCASLYPKNFGSHCNVCFSRLIAPIACNDCASIAFCSVACKDIALNSYHKYECKYLDMLIGSGMSILCQIALKIVTNCKTPEEALKHGKSLLDGLCKHAQARKNEDYFKRGFQVFLFAFNHLIFFQIISGLMSTFLLRILQKSEFFGRRKTGSGSEIFHKNN